MLSLECKVVLKPLTFKTWNCLFTINIKNANKLSNSKYELASDCCLMPIQQFCSYIMAITSYIWMRWWECQFCTRPTHLNELCNASSLKQQFVGRHAAPLRQIILISSQSIFTLVTKYYMLSREAANTNFIVVGLTGAWINDLLHSRRTCWQLHHRCSFKIWHYPFTTNILDIAEILLKLALNTINYQPT